MNVAPLLRSAIFLPIIAILVFLLPACSGDDPSSPNGDSGKVKTGDMKQVFEQSVAGGTTVTVSAAGTAVDGLVLDVPTGAYASSKNVTISYADITGHDFGSNFNPVTPLIRIENGGGFAAKPMRLRIPLPDMAGRFPVAFYYDRAAGTLEAIAPVGRSDTWLDVAVRHFSEIVVSTTQIELLREGGGFHTFFEPKINGWPFVNYGPYPEPGGMCAGMSIGAAHFYRNFSASILLSAHFDNDLYWFQTPKVWEDDATGIKFCGELQKAFVTSNAFWTTGGGTPFDDFLQKSEEDHFWSICYALLVVNQPQFLYLAVRGSSSTPAHAISAYAYEIDGNEGRLKVYDPNYPGSEGTIIFDFATKKFRPYTSAANTRALQEGYTFAFDQIVFIPMSTICDMKEVDRIWQKVAANTIGSGQYPSYELWAVPVDNQDLPRVKLLDGATGQTTFLPYREFRVEIVPTDKNIPFSLTAWIELTDIGEMEKHEPAGIVTLESDDKNNLVGIQVNAKAAGETNASWAGFHWFKIRLQSLWIEPADTSIGIGEELRLLARHNGTAPAGARFEWDFGDGKTQSVTGDSVVQHTWTTAGDASVRVEVFAPGGTAPIGSSVATVHVSSFQTIMVSLIGMSSTPPSTIKATDGSDIPSIIWSNKQENAPPLVWNNNEFFVEYDFTAYGVRYDTRISGRLNTNGSGIDALTAIMTGTSTNWTFTSVIAITNFPLGSSIPGWPLGSELIGPAGESKVGNITWRTTSTDSKGNVTTAELKSIDWSSDETKLAVYLYR